MNNKKKIAIIITIILIVIIGISVYFIANKKEDTPTNTDNTIIQQDGPKDTIDTIPKNILQTPSGEV